MAKINHKLLLERAEREFLEGDYSDALRNYGLVLNDYPSLDEAKIGVFLSDFATESEDEAQALFDYYQIIKDKQKDAVDTIDSMINNLTISKKEIQKLLVDSLKEKVEYSDGIRYSDFLTLIESRGSFKKAFEDIMFSTKVIISNKDEFIDFVQQLKNEGFDEMALQYLDASTNRFGNDQDILALYNVVSSR